VYDWRVYPVLDVTRAVGQLVAGFMMHGVGVALISVVALHGSIFLFGGFT
jgi:hypothetical protein